MRFKWDKSKNQLLVNDRRRGLSFERVRTLFDLPYYLDERIDDREQFRAIGFVDGRLITLIFEQREDDIGDYLHLVTYWPSTKAERKLYEKS
jgi:uncharacterized DUF497 family protein